MLTFLDYGNKKRKKTFYDKNELKLFLEAVYKYDSFMWFTFFRILAFTGMRKGEALALKWPDINLNDNTLSINKTLAEGYENRLIVQSPKTEASKRIISIDKKTMEIIKEWKKKQAKLLIGFGFNALNPEQLIFSKLESNDVWYLNAPRSRLIKVCKEADLPTIHIHGFRHTHCSLLFEAGLAVKDVQARLGHSDMQTTLNIYTHVTEESKDKSAELFQAYVNF